MKFTKTRCVTTPQELGGHRQRVPVPFEILCSSSVRHTATCVSDVGIMHAVNVLACLQAVRARFLNESERLDKSVGPKAIKKFRCT